jgi:hypothetical protein
LALIASLCLSVPAAAQSISPQAQALFKEGKTLMAAKDYAKACDAFAASYKLSPVTATLLNHADCREKNQQLFTAWGLFNDVERATRGATDAASKAMNTTAAGRAKKLEPRLSKLTVNVAATPGLSITRNGEAIDAATWNIALPIDGGAYTFVARAPDRKEWTGSVSVTAEGDAKTLEVPALEAVPVKPDIVSDTKPDKVVIEKPAVVPAKRSLMLPIVFGSAALVLGGTAVGFSLWGDSIYEDAEREPNDARQESLWKSANKRRYAAEGFAIGAVGCVVAAVVFYVRGKPSEAPSSSGVSVSPTASANAMGMSISGSW